MNPSELVELVELAHVVAPSSEAELHAVAESIALERERLRGLAEKVRERDRELGGSMSASLQFTGWTVSGLLSGLLVSSVRLVVVVVSVVVVSAGLVHIRRKLRGRHD